MNSNTGYFRFYAGTKCLGLEINSQGIKECGSRITDLGQENRFRLRKTDKKRFDKSLECFYIHANNWGSEQVERIKPCILEQDKRQNTGGKKHLKTAYILIYKLSKSMIFLENVLDNVQ